MFDFIKQYYDLHFIKKLMKVEVYGKVGKIVGANGSYLKIKLEGSKHWNFYHPTDGICYFDKKGNVLKDFRIK